MEVTEERFRALARSSPWRWQTLRFTLVRRPEREPFGAGVRACLRRPGLLRVENLDGDLVRVVHEEQPRTVGLLTTDGGRDVPLEEPRSVAPVVDADGLVRERPWMLNYDAPMFQDYHWVAMLDPVELADGHDGGPGTVLRDLREVDHHGRRAWEAVLEPTDAYDPRCSCCSLLLSAVSEEREAEAGGPTIRSRDPGFRFADAHRVRLDVETGVCVYAEQQGGDRDGYHHRMRIEAVDEPMPDELFPARTRRGRRGRRRR